jgi:TonB family protein
MRRRGELRIVGAVAESAQRTPAGAPVRADAPMPAGTCGLAAPAKPPKAPDRADRLARWFGIGGALTLHAAALAAMLFVPLLDNTSGAGGQRLEAIEVTLVQSTVFQSRDRTLTEPPAEASGEITPEEPKPEDKREELAQPKPDQPAIVAEEPVAPPKEEPKEEQRVQPQPQIQSAGDGAAPTGGPAAASPGAISRYAAEVRAALARNKPNGRGRNGTVTVTFTISPTGAVSATRVTQSSGHAALDQATLAAVARTAFPRPPAGMTERDLTYVVPFRFQ